MAILNFTTKISAAQSASEISVLLQRAGARAIMTEFDDENVLSHISFRIETAHGMMSFRLPANIDGVHAALQGKGVVDRHSYRTRQHASNVAWRIIKDWVAAQIAIIEADMATLPQIFLPYAQTDTGETVYERFQTGGLKMIGNK